MRVSPRTFLMVTRGTQLGVSVWSEAFIYLSPRTVLRQHDRPQVLNLNKLAKLTKSGQSQTAVKILEPDRNFSENMKTASTREIWQNREMSEMHESVTRILVPSGLSYAILPETAETARNAHMRHMAI